MWFDGQRQPNTIYVASVSRGKDSTAMLRAIQLMGWPLDAICSVDIWATQDIPAELPPMVAFKEEWDKKVLERFGVPVTRLCAMKDGKKVSYNDIFYRKISPKREREKEYANSKTLNGSKPIFGFPLTRGGWCNAYIKVSALRDSKMLDAVGVLENSNKDAWDLQHAGRSIARANSNKPRYESQTKKENFCVGYLRKEIVRSFPKAPRTRRKK